MLGLGASHLSLLAPGDFNHDALQHRVTAIQRLNKFLSKPNLSVSDTEAAFAAILTLTFQAAHMPDGLTDFLSMTRGCKSFRLLSMPKRFRVESCKMR